jgi:hypothetical protein
MKPQRFKPGDHVVCVNGNWGLGGPKRNDVVEIECYAPPSIAYPEYNFIYLRGYENHPFTSHPEYRIDFNEVHFEPLVSDAVLAEALSEILITVNA